jgi:hypothetical protein
MRAVLPPSQTMAQQRKSPRIETLQLVEAGGRRE